MTTAQVVETSVTINSNSPIQDYVHPDDQTQPTFEMTPGFKPFTINILFKTLLGGNSASRSMLWFNFIIGLNFLFFCFWV